MQYSSINSISSTIGELIENLYIERSVIRNKGMFKGYQYIVYEKPKANNPTSVNPTSENPPQISKEENKILNNKDILENFKIEINGFDIDENIKIDFLEYWLEPSPSGKTRFEMQKTWCSRRRMKTWMKNQKSWNKTTKKDKVDNQVNAWLSARELIKNRNGN